MNDIIYSGDIICISEYGSSPRRYLQRSSNTSILVMGQTEQFESNLSKLRIQCKKHDAMRNIPLSYGEHVHIMHNANRYNRNMPLYIKISDHLLSHQEGGDFRDFVLLSVDNPASTGLVRPDVPIAIKNRRCGDIDTGYLVMDKATGKINNSAKTIQSATKFVFSLERAFEVADRHLCACNGDVIFP